MKNIGGFFEKFQNKVAAQVQDLVLVAEVIKKRTGLELDIKDLKVSNGTLRFKASSLEKNEVFIKKSLILKDLKGRTRTFVIAEIA